VKSVVHKVVKPRGAEARLLLLACALLVGLFGARISYATDIYREPWHWSREIPAAVVPAKPPATQRESRAFNRLHIGAHTSMRDLIAKVGVPDAFAPQFFFTQSEAGPVDRAGGGPEAGTFRYALRDGREVLVSVSDFHTIKAVWRIQKSGVRQDLYLMDNL